MKTIAVLLVLAAGANAGVIFGTGVPGSIETNNFNGVNVATNLYPGWYPAVGSSVWESIRADSLNPVIPNGTEVDFTFTFNLPGDPTNGFLSVMSDDGSRVSVNGVALVDSRGGPAQPTCSADFPMCIYPLTLDITSDLHFGANSVDVLVRQEYGTFFGVDLYGAVDYKAHVNPPPQEPPAVVPEPATLAVVGLGLTAVWWARRRA